MFSVHIQPRCGTNPCPKIMDHMICDGKNAREKKQVFFKQKNIIKRVCVKEALKDSFIPRFTHSTPWCSQDCSTYKKEDQNQSFSQG